MSFKVNDKVTVVSSGSQYSTYDKWVKIYASQWMDQWMDCDKCIDTTKGYTVVAKGKHEECNKMLYLIQCDDKVYIIGEQGIKAVETVGFKVGNKVRIKDKCTWMHGYTGIINELEVIDGDLCYYVTFDENNNGGNSVLWEAKELELATESITYKEALLHTLNKTKQVRHTSMAPGEYLVFDGKWTDNNGIRRDINSINDNDGHWEEFTEPPKPPRFTTGTLVYNTDGTIGKIVEDKGVYKGIRKYSVSFNAIRDTVKTVDETELTEYKQ